jgi:N-acetylglutamate synthase-like GNAT family acetyltransferase
MGSSAAGIEAAGVAVDTERLDVYRVAREFDVFASRLLPRRGCASLRDQLARGSAMECLAVLDVAQGRGLVAAAAHCHGRGLLLRVVQMLTKLARRMQA